MQLFETRLKSHHDAFRRLKDTFELSVDKEVYLDSILNKPAERERVMYLHVPFCTKRCSFCMFHSGDKTLKENYHTIITQEIEKHASFEYMQKPFSSVYFGGGTPTSLEPEQMDVILQSIHSNFNLYSDCEISLETSITELSPQMIDVLLKNKVNRLSIGVQSFNDRIRKVMARRGSGEKAIEKIQELKKAGLENVNIDLIYNCPGETLEELKYDLDIIRELGLGGISFYSLMIHPDAPINKIIKPEELKRMQDVQHDLSQHLLILEELKPAGFDVFEFSKIVRNNIDKYKYIAVRHDMGDCVAFGRKAGGNIHNYAYSNALEPKIYSDKVPISVRGRVLDEKYYILDKFNKDLQKMGTNLPAISDLLGFDLEKNILPAIEKFSEYGYVQYSNKILRMTEEGIFWGFNIIDDFLSCILSSKEVGIQ